MEVSSKKHERQNPPMTSCFSPRFQFSHGRCVACATVKSAAGTVGSVRDKQTHRKDTYRRKRSIVSWERRRSFLLGKGTSSTGTNGRGHVHLSRWLVTRHNNAALPRQRGDEWSGCVWREWKTDTPERMSHATFEERGVPPLITVARDCVYSKGHTAVGGVATSVV